MADRGGGDGADRALDRFWDGVARGAAEAPPDGAAPGLDPADAAAVRRFHALPDAPGPAPSFVARLEEELMRPHAIPNIARPVKVGAANGAARVGWALPPAPPARRPPRRRLWGRALEGLAAAALLLAIAAGLATGWGVLPGRGERTTAPRAFGQATPGAAVVPGAAMERGNAARTGEVAGPGPKAEPDLRWRAPIAMGEWEYGSFWGPPVVVDGVAYLGGGFSSGEEPGGHEAGFVLALDAASGAERWRTTVVDAGAGGEPASSVAHPPTVEVGKPAVADGIVYVPTIVSTAVGEMPQIGPTTDEAAGGVVETESLSALVALDAATGTERWRVPTGKSESLSTALVDGFIYVPVDGAVLALDAATGVERWRTTVQAVERSPGEGVWLGTPAVAAGSVFVADGRTLYALDARSGAERWRFRGDREWVGDPVVANGSAYVWSDAAGARPFGGVSSGLLYALDAATGAERWTYTGDSSRSPPTVGAGLLYLTDLSGDQGDDTRIAAVDAATGRERWSATVDGYGADLPVLAGGILYFGTFQDGWLDLGDFGGLFGLGDRNYLYALDAASGRQVWRVETERFSSAPAVADGTAYLTTGGDDGNAGTLHAYGGG